MCLGEYSPLDPLKSRSPTPYLTNVGNNSVFTLHGVCDVKSYK